MDARRYGGPVVRPPVPSVLITAANQLRARIPSCMNDPEFTRELWSAARALDLAAAEYEVCADWRVQDITELNGLLARGARLWPDRFSWAEDVDEQPVADFKISSLEARLDVLRQYLIELQTALEDSDEDEPTQLIADVFRFEAAVAGRRGPQKALW